MIIIFIFQEYTKIKEAKVQIRLLLLFDGKNVVWGKQYDGKIE